METYSISKLAGTEPVDFDALPVAKITHYPNELFDWKPYAQVSVAINKKVLAFRFTCFEVKNLGKSWISAVVFPFEDDSFFRVNVMPDHGTAMVNSQKVGVVHRKTTGEDLQGKFWGGEIFVELSELEKHGVLKLGHADEIKGNFFKANKTDEGVHVGSFGRATLEHGESYHKEAMSVLRIVEY